MEQKKKTVTVTLELDPELVGFHKRVAEDEEITLEARLVNIIKKATEEEQAKRREKAKAFTKHLNATAKKLGILAPPSFEEDEIE